MKKSVLAVALVIFMAVAAQAQVTIDYTRQSRNSSLTVTYSSGCGYGYGFGGGFGTGIGGSYYGGGYGYGYGYPGSGYYSPGGPMAYSLGAGSYYSGPYGGGYYGGYYGGFGGYHAGLSRPYASADAAGPVNRSGLVPDRMAEFASVREIEEGRKRLKMGDYRGAVDLFRAAVTAQTDSPLAQAWFAVALAITGDARNAEKSLRAAAAGGLAAERIGLVDGFRDEKERARVVASLSRSGGDGGLAVAFALSAAGEPAKLKQMAEKDPVARQLLPK